MSTTWQLEWIHLQIAHVRRYQRTINAKGLHKNQTFFFVVDLVLQATRAVFGHHLCFQCCLLSAQRVHPSQDSVGLHEGGGWALGDFV